MRNAFIKDLLIIAQNDPDVILLTADNGAIVFDEFRKKYPQQFVNCGISETTMVSVAAGLAACGKKPFIYTIIPFLIMRTFEFIRNDICMPNLNVKIIGIGGGMRYSTLGPTHHALEDIAVMKALPCMTVVCPADPREAGLATKAIYDHSGPVYLRMGTTKEEAVYQDDYDFNLGQAVLLKDGGDVTFIAAGSILKEVMTAAQELDKVGIAARVVNMHTIKPLDQNMVIRCGRETKAILTVEEHNLTGGLGESVASCLAENGPPAPRFKRLAIPDIFCSGFGVHDYLKAKHGLSAQQILREAEQLCRS